MAEIVGGAAPKRERGSLVATIGGLVRATEVDTRMLGMIAALAIVWIGFNFMSGGVFLTPRNLWNLSVQTAAIGVLATGMVLVIVTRNIDLSVGSLVAFVGMVMGAVQTEILPPLIGFDYPATWAITLVVGILLGTFIGAVQGYIIAYLSVPSFIVTLGGLLVWRGAAWWVASGKTLAPLDTNFQIIGGGATGSIGATASWVVGVVACAGIVVGLLSGRRQRRKFNFPLRPVWAEIAIAVVGCGAVLGGVMIANSYPLPVGLARQYAETHNIPWPETGGLFIPLGIAVPVLIAAGAGLVLSFLASRTRFGRYVFAIGGNPEAAVLAGINTRWVILKVFALMGALCAVSAAISTARLNAATNALGNLYELYTIAAAVIGGTSFAGGIGTVAGALMGALVMQSLQSGMVLLGLDAPLQNIVVGAVLVLAVWLDTLYRRRSA
jgi:D-xylose transport system permease protein